MGYPKCIIPQAVRRLAFGSITGTFANLGTALTRPLRILHIKNTTNQTAEVSINGTEVNFEIPANSFDLYDITTNKAASDEAGMLRSAIQLQVRRPAAEANPTSGAVIVQSWVGEI